MSALGSLKCGSRLSAVGDGGVRNGGGASVIPQERAQRASVGIYCPHSGAGHGV